MPGPQWSTRLNDGPVESEPADEGTELTTTTSIAEPSSLCCPITHVLFKDPVFVPEVGTTFERSAILAFWASRTPARDPLTNATLRSKTLFVNWDKRREVAEWLSQHPAYTPQGWDSREDVPRAEPSVDEDACFVQCTDDLGDGRLQVRIDVPTRYADNAVVVQVGSVQTEHPPAREHQAAAGDVPDMEDDGAPLDLKTRLLAYALQIACGAVTFCWGFGIFWAASWPGEDMTVTESDYHPDAAGPPWARDAAASGLVLLQGPANSTLTVVTRQADWAPERFPPGSPILGVFSAREGIKVGLSSYPASIAVAIICVTAIGYILSRSTRRFRGGHRIGQHCLLVAYVGWIAGLCLRQPFLRASQDLWVEVHPGAVQVFSRIEGWHNAGALVPLAQLRDVDTSGAELVFQLDGQGSRMRWGNLRVSEFEAEWALSLVRRSILALADGRTSVLPAAKAWDSKHHADVQMAFLDRLRTIMGPPQTRLGD